MNFVQFYQEAGWVAYVQTSGLIFGTLWCVVCAGMLAFRWRVPAVVSLVPLALFALFGAIGVSVASQAVEGAVAGADPSMRAVLMAAGISEMLHGDVLLAFSLPAAVVLVLGGAAGGVRPPRAFGAPALVFFLLSLVALLPLGDLFYGASFGGVLLRVLGYALGVIPVTLSCLNNGMQTNGREASVTATIAFFCAVAALETAVTGFAYSALFGALAAVDVGERARVLATAIGELSGPAWLANVRLFLALAAVFVAALRPVRAPTEEEILAGTFNPSPIRALGTVMSFGVVILWLIAANASAPGETLTRVTTFFGT